MEPTNETPAQEAGDAQTAPVDTNLTVTSGDPATEDPTVPDAPVTSGATLVNGVQPLVVKEALLTAHKAVDVAHSLIKNTEVSAVEGVSEVEKALESAKEWLVSEVRKYDPATADELASK